MVESGEQDPELKIAAYREQLAQIEAYLTSDQTNPEWLKLKKDIEHVIQMTETLIEVQKKEASEGKPKEVPVEAPPPVEKYEAVSEVQVGDRVEVIGDRPYAGIVTGVNPELAECTLKYYEVGKEVTLPFSKMRLLINKNSLPSDSIAPGLKCQCRYAPDRKWYDVVIEKVTPHGYVVTYTKFGNKEEVPLEYLRNTPISALKVEKSEGSSVVIPENLKILPTDTEEEKQKKKKRIKSIKNKNRLENLDKERSAVQNTWKAFETKTLKQAKKHGGVPHVKKRSMFASPEEVEGRVGFTRSGKGMTQNEERKRYKLNGPSS